MTAAALPRLSFATLGWDRQGFWLLDQTKLPATKTLFRPRTLPELLEAIQRMVVRGAPALGCAGAYGLAFACQTAQERHGFSSTAAAAELLEQAAVELRQARPTAVNLAVGVDHALAAGRAALQHTAFADSWWCPVLTAAEAFHEDDRRRCLALAEQGLSLLSPGSVVLTHCNAGALATGGIGTALAPLHLGAARGLALQVFADETRPLRQGARLTAWEMAQSGIPVKVLVDGAAGSLLASGVVDHILVGADRIAANGDVANKIGTYPLAVLAHRHGVPFHVLAPATTVDVACLDGSEIPIEQRSAEELLAPDALQQGVGVYQPAFDVTPASLLSGIILEDGIYSPGSQAWQEKVVALRAQAETG